MKHLILSTREGRTGFAPVKRLVAVCLFAVGAAMGANIAFAQNVAPGIETAAPAPAPRLLQTLSPRAEESRLVRAGSFNGDLRDLPSTGPDRFENYERPSPHVKRVELPYSGPIPEDLPLGPVVRATAPAPIANFVGLDLTGFGSGYPPDTNGDVGPNYFIQSVNSSIGIYDKLTGTRVVGLSLNTFMRQGNFGNVCDTSNRGDPVVLYDTFEDRWIITDFAFTTTGNDVNNPPGMFQCFAASKTSDPVSGGWNFYSFNTTGGFGDYGKFSIWPDGLYATFNMFNYVASAGFQNVRVAALNKTQMYAGNPSVQIVSFDLPSSEFTVLPSNARLQSGTPPVGTPNLYSVVWQFTNVISVYKFKADWNNISLSSFTGPFDTIAPASWASAPSTVPASGGNANDTLQPRLMVQNQYTNIGGVESLWNSHTVLGGAGQASPRFYQVNVTGGTIAASTTQAFTHSPNATINRYMPSVAVDRSGNMAMVYSASSSTLSTAVRYAGRLAADALNTLPQTEQSLFEGPGAQTFSNRWGDYSSMTLDVDGCTFWMTTEYYATVSVASNWQTRIGSFKFPSCTALSTFGTLSGTVTLSPGGTPISGATVTFGSRTATTNASGVYTFSNLPAGTYHGLSAAAVGDNTSATVNNLVITGGATTTQNFALTAASAAACLVDTSMADFQAGVPTSVDLTSSPGNATLSELSGALDQQNTSLSGSGNSITTTQWIGQSFVPAISGQLVQVDINLFCAGGCSGTVPITVQVRSTSLGLPTATVLATATIASFTSGAGTYYSAVFGSPATLTAGTTYSLNARVSAANPSGTYAAQFSTGSPYSSGTQVATTNSGTSWFTIATDLGFRTYMTSGFVTTGNLISSNKFANPAANLVPFWTTLSWTGSTPASTTLRFQVAGSNEAFGPFNFIGPGGTAATFYTTSGASLSQFNGFRYLKYKALLNTSLSTSTPTLNDVTACFSNQLSGVPGSEGLQIGSVTVPATIAGVNGITRVTFSQSYVNPPVVIVQIANDNADPAALRITNVTRNGFDVLQVEAPGCAGCTALTGATVVNWLAASPGSYRVQQNSRSAFGISAAPNAVGPGPLLKVGTISTSANQRSTASGFVVWPSTSWQAVTYPAGETFVAAPVVLMTLQTWNNEGPNFNGPVASLKGTSQIWATPVANNVDTGGFDVAIESSEVDDDDVPGPGLNFPEVVGYVAIERPVSMQLTQFGSASVVGIATGNSTANDSCVITDLTFPATAPLVAANLRGFAGKQSRLETDGGWLRRCAMSAPGGSVVRMTMRVDEDAYTDAERLHPTSETIGAAIFGGDFITSPITLARTSVQAIGDQLKVSFSTATEVSHLGFRIWGRANADLDWTALHDDLIFSASGDGMKSKSYTRVVASGGSSEIRIEDVDLLGRSRFSSTIAVGADVGTDAINAPINWSAIRAANAASPVRQIQATGAKKVLLQVKTTGIQRVTYADLVAAGWSAGNVAARDIAVLDAAAPVLRHVECADATFGPGCSIEFLGVASSSLYSEVNSYAIVVDEKLAKVVASGAFADGPAVPRTVQAQLQVAPNRAYSFSAPGNDPWYDERILATTQPVSINRSFALPERGAGPVSIDVDLWGGLDFAAPGLDHSIALSVNGVELRALRFDGLTAQRVHVEVPENLITANNTLTLKVNADTGFAADVVLLDGYSVNYSRLSNASSGELKFGSVSNSGNGASDQIFGGDFEVRSGFAVNGLSGPASVWTQAGASVRRDVVNAAAVLDARVTDLILAETPKLLRPSVVAATPGNINTTPVDYLIITHPLFEAELVPIVTLEQSRGYSVRVLRTDEIYAAKSDYAPSPQAIREVISQINPRFVLLVGGDSYDYNDYLGVGSQSYLPTFYHAADQIVRFAATDALFSDANGDGVPERALGRIPARTVAEMRLAISSIVQRGNTPAARYLAVAGASNSAEHFDIHSRSLLSYLRQGQPKEFALVDELGITEARAKAAAGLGGDADWINYLGHSSPNRWASQNLLDTSQLSSINRSGIPAVVSQWGCWNNYFVMPDQDTMAHALMLRSNRLASSVIGSTSLAEDASHMALGTRFFDLVEDGRIGDREGKAINTLGEALMAAKADLARSNPENIESNYSITLFGDPAAVLR